MLGTLLFLVFISDLLSAIPNSTVDIYADDTACSSSSHYSLGVTELQPNLQLHVDCLSEWSLQNHMVLNTDKTKSILVSGKRLRSRLDNSTLDLQLNGTTIGQVTSQKLLGVTLDEELSFREHVEKLCKKLSQKIGLLNKIHSYLPIQERKLYYNALVKPTMMYGSLVWTYCSTEDLKRVFRLPKRAARVILQVDTRSRTVDNFKKLSWIPFYNEVKINKCILVFKKLNGDVPNFL